MPLVRSAFVALLMLTCAADGVSAQTRDGVILALGVGSSSPSTDSLDASFAVSPSVHFRTGTGWVPMATVSWFNYDTPFLDIRMVPVMGGIAYRVQSGPWWLAPGVAAGYSFNRARVAIDPTQRITLENGFAWRSGIAVGYDATERVSIGGSAGYLVSRSTLDFGNVRGSPPSRFDGDGLVLTIELGFRPF